MKIIWLIISILISLTLNLAPIAQITTIPTKSNNYIFLIVPDDGLYPIYSLITSAKKTIDMTMFSLNDSTIESLLAQAAARGVQVRVILDRSRSKINIAAYNNLSNHGVKVHWSNPQYKFTHQKSLIVDGKTLVILTGNWVNLPAARNYYLIENDSKDLAAVETTFNADFIDTAINPPLGDNLVWSPTNASAALFGLINEATHSLWIEAFGIYDPSVVNALIAAAKRGVDVRLVTNINMSSKHLLQQLRDGRVKVSIFNNKSPLFIYPQFNAIYSKVRFIHAKVILVDYGSPKARLFLGSENLSRTSLTKNRELGVILADPSAMTTFAKIFIRDFLGGVPFHEGQ